MRLALHLGERNLGRTWPNPSVGAVIVSFQNENTPVILAQGITQPGGRPHAERVALTHLKGQAKNSTLYVTLEPCSHFGKTTPCVDAILEAGVARVVCAVRDPDPRVSGRGLEKLRTHGVAVTEGILQKEGYRLHEGHINRVTQNRPFVTTKIAMSRDGYAASRISGRIQISCPQMMQRVHMMRAKTDAIMVGINTVLIDDPLLTVRLSGMEKFSPVRIVIDSHLRLPLTSQLVKTAEQFPLWVLCSSHITKDRLASLKDRGVRVFVVSGKGESVDLTRALPQLAEAGLTTIFCEGGPSVLSSLAQNDLIDRFILSEGVLSIGNEGVPALLPVTQQAVEDHLRLSVLETVGTDSLRIFERLK